MNAGQRGGFGNETASAQEEDAVSQKGVKAETTLTLSGGTLSIDSVDDALHAVDVTVSGGEMTLATGDDGVHADNTLTISGGNVTVWSGGNADNQPLDADGTIAIPDALRPYMGGKTQLG